MSRMLVAVLGVLSAIALVVVQFTPWGGIDQGGFEVNAYTWKLEMSAEGFFGSGEFSDKQGWYSDEVEENEESDADHSDLTKIRIAIPLLGAGLLLAAVGALLAFLGRGPSPLLLLVGGVLTAVATVLFGLALDSMFDSDQDWGASFYLAIAASAMALVGGIVGMVGGTRSSS